MINHALYITPSFIAVLTLRLHVHGTKLAPLVPWTSNNNDKVSLKVTTAHLTCHYMLIIKDMYIWKNKCYIKLKPGQSRIDNLDTLALLSTQDTGGRQTKQKTQHRKLIR